MRNVGSESTSGLPIRPRVSIEAPFDDAVCDVWFGAEQALPAPAVIDPPTVSWTRVAPTFNPRLLGRLVERANATLLVELLVDAEVIWSERFPITLLAANEWLHDSSFYDSLAAFVLPNSTALRPVLDRARSLLEERTGDPRTYGYQGEASSLEASHARVFQVAEAVYDSLREVGFNYSNPPGDFTGQAQRVRSPQTIVDERAATCLDSSVLYAAALAQVGLEPVLFLVEEHAFAGFALFGGVTRQLPPVVDSRAELMRLVEKGLVQPVETTTLCGRENSASFQVAAQNPLKYFRDQVAQLEAMVVVSAAWRQGIAPPPTTSASMLEDTSGEHPAHSMRGGALPPPSDLPVADSDFEYGVTLGTGVDRPPPRVRQWMNSLLDLSSRNSLLKMQVRQKNGKETNRFMEFVVPPESLGKIDDALFTPRAKLVIQMPGDLPATYKANGITMPEFAAELAALKSPLIYPSFDKINELPAVVKKWISDRDAGHQDLRGLTDLDLERLAHANFKANCEAQLRERATKLKVAADEKLLATGSNPLHLALGVLTWSEQTAGRSGAAATTEYAAPLFLYPAVLEGGKGAPLTLRLDGSGSITPNYCLQEKLRRPPYNLELPELSTPQADALGIDVDKMIESIENKLRAAKLNNFAVQRRCVLGVFEYSTFRLWKDLHDNWTEMRDASAVVRHLMYTPGERMADHDVASDAAALEPYCAIEADDSQVEAIRWALEGRSFRLEGPPGTGKTQTITNLIASCLAHGKKILFVAEKQTALQQVKKRLHSIGLGDYSLELHAKGDSDTRLRKNIAEQVSGAMEASADPREHDWEELSGRVRLEERALDAYRNALHDLSPAELSLWKAREGLAAIGDGTAVHVPRAFLDQYRALRPRLREVEFDLPNLVQIAGGLHESPWRMVDRLDFERLDRSALTTRIAELRSATAELLSLQDEWAPARQARESKDLQLLCDAADLRTSGYAVAPGGFQHGVGSTPWVERARLRCNELDARRAALAPHLQHLGNGFPERADIAQLVSAAQAAVAAKWPTAGKKLREVQQLVGTAAISSDPRSIAEAVLGAAPVVVLLQASIEQARRDLSLAIPPDAALNLELLTGKLRHTIDSISSLTSSAASDEMRTLSHELATATTDVGVGGQVVRRFADAWDEFVDIVGVGAPGLQRWRGNRSLVDATNEALNAWGADRGEQDRYLRLQRWADVAAHANTLEECGLGHLRDDVMAGNLNVAELGQMVERGVLTAAIEERLEAGNIDNFDGQSHDLRIEKFEKTLAELRRLMTERIPGLIVSRRQQQRSLGRHAGHTADLLRELKPLRGEKTPIRTLLEKFGTALVDTMPCFMMSPDSVATLLPIGAITFDLVIFDEASQVKTANAIGALGRGRANIVVGDSKQMPPATAFSANQGRFEAEDDDDLSDPPELVEGAEEIETAVGDGDALLVGAAARDVESILQEFEAAAVPYLQLLCHYRSKDELLIAFSNAEIYERPMLTFPSIDGMSSKALEFRRVDGQFLRKRTLLPDPADPTRKIDGIRTNQVEAAAVVEEVLDRLRDPHRQARRLKGKRAGDESIIVVTFNKPQQELIRLMLEAADDPDSPVVSPALMEEKDDETGVLIADAQLKIRNLETVQGDEAETVIFSFAFSKLAADERKTASSRVPLNFGPVTQDGGHRRLNVAVTRAQRKMIVFCSFDPLDMDVKPTSSEGARLVQKFLLLAKNGPRSTGDIGVGGSRSKHIDDIANAIQQHGYRVQTQLGLSSLRVDIAVGLPGRDDWNVAIMADGPQWAERGSAYQREILPKNILSALGWQQVLRVWLPSWIDERDAILKRILAKLNDFAEQAVTAATADTSPAVEIVDVAAPSDADDQPAVPQLPPPAWAPPRAPKPVTSAPAGSVLPDSTLEVTAEVAPVDPTGQSEDAPKNPTVDAPPSGDDDDLVDALPPRRPVLVAVTTQPKAAIDRPAPGSLFVPFVPHLRGSQGVLDLIGSGNSTRLVRDTIVEVLDSEAPIVAERLGRLVANCFDLVTVRQARIDAILQLVPKNCQEKTPLGVVVWATPEQRKEWTSYRISTDDQRTFAEVPLPELVNALVSVVAESPGIAAEAAMRDVASQFGLKKLGAKVRERLDAAVTWGTRHKVLDIDNDQLSIPR